MSRRRAPDRGGRPSKFTPTTGLRLVAALGDGQSLHDAARAAGVGKATVYRWMDRGRRGDPGFEALAAAVEVARRGASHVGPSARCS